jgi:pimeloyl-ACP methyl ester carboxylesterase
MPNHGLRPGRLWLAALVLVALPALNPAAGLGQAATAAARLAEVLVAPDASQRYHPGLRLRQLERAWAQASPERRASAVPLIQGAVRGFFAGRAREVSAGLDRAVAVLEGELARPPARLLADALDLSLSPALTDPTSTPVLRLALHYPVKAAPTTLTLKVWRDPGASRQWQDPRKPSLTRSLYPAKPKAVSGSRATAPRSHGRLVTQRTCRVQAGFSARIPLELGALPRGVRESDEILWVEMATPSGEVLRRVGVVVSRAGNLRPRLTALQEAWNSGDRAPRDGVVRETVRFHLALLQRLAWGPPEETDRPAAGLLRAMEVIMALPPDTPRLAALGAGLRATSDHTLTVSTLPGAFSPALVRVGGDVDQWTTAGLARAVVAMHGAGGSENMFHDAYGLGSLADWCRHNHRLFLAPRLYSPADDFWSRLEPLLDSNSSTGLVLVGHSMGSLAAMEMARQQPDSVRGVAAISVGGRGDVAPLKGMPVLVAAGARDFGRASSQRLYERLQQAQARARWHLTDSEHLMVVADAIPEVTAWIRKLPR